MGKLNKKALRNLYILTMTLTLTVYVLTKISTFTLPWYYTYFHCVIWIFLYIVLWRQQNRKVGSNIVRRSQYIVMHIFLTPYVIFFFCTILGWLVYIEDISFHNITRAISNYLHIILYFFSTYATFAIFKEQLIDYTFIAISISYLFTIVAAIFHYGIVNFIETGLLPFGELANTFVQGGNASNVLEVNDLTFAAGFYLIYYLMWNHDRQKQVWRRIIWCVVLIYLGYKRIQLAALLTIIIAAVFITRRSKKGVAYWSVVCTIGMLIVMYAYIWLIDAGGLSVLAERYNIDFMGRLKAYNIMSHYITFSPAYIGRGMGSGLLLNSREIAAGIKILSGHSDVMFNYIDFGFIGFTLWIICCFYYATNYFRYRSSPNTARLWLLFTLYAFIVYLTDNTQSYFIFQTSYMLIMYHVMYKDQLLKHLESNH